MTFTITIDDDAVMAGLQAQRRAINQDVKKTTLIAGEKTVLPTTKRLAPRIVRGPLVIRSTTQGAYITTKARGRWRRTTGLLNFGGVVKAPIFPVFARALKIGPGIYRSAVLTPRFYKPMNFMRKSIDMNFSRYTDSIQEQMTDLLRRRITSARTFG